MQTTKNRISATRAPANARTQTPVASKLGDCFRANIKAPEVYGRVRINAQKLRRQAAHQENPLFATRTCLTCAVRTKCAGFDPCRQAACAGKVAPLPAVKR